MFWFWMGGFWFDLLLGFESWVWFCVRLGGVFGCVSWDFV